MQFQVSLLSQVDEEPMSDQNAFPGVTGEMGKPFPEAKANTKATGNQSKIGVFLQFITILQIAIGKIGKFSPLSFFRQQAAAAAGEIGQR